ncbi:MAG: 3-phosphoserine/phosphohydroxythreonine transaminase [Bacteroidales bacterium]|nr:3-phosphoserine/phosphohydroxythreonine transaminase [Bacteroidales bacterium]
MNKHNFYAGPSILPEFTIENVAKAVKDFEGTGLSIMEISHRSKEFISVMDQTQQLFKELLNIPDGYHVLFLGGGASTQFAMIPMNLMKSKSAYLDTGSWASKAIKEAHNFGEVVVVASSKDANYSYIPEDFIIPPDVDYFHITTNNTIYGTEIKKDMDVNLPLIADMSSDIFSRPVDVSKYAVIYGGAQKNLAPAGLTFVIVKEDILGKVDRVIPTMFDYRTHIEKGSMFNTPPCLPVYAALQTLIWLKDLGGVTAIHKINCEKADLLYKEIDRNKLFITTVKEEKNRSIMNVCWVMNKEYAELEKDFLDLVTEKGMVGIKGHRSVGGFRASIYNALPMNSVEILISIMQEFEDLKA